MRYIGRPDGPAASNSYGVSFAYVNDSGGTHYRYATYSLGVRFAFVHNHGYADGNFASPGRGVRFAIVHHYGRVFTDNARASNGVLPRINIQLIHHPIHTEER